MILAPLLMLASMGCKAADYVIPPAMGSGGRFVVTADRAPVETVGGEPAFPVGTTLEVRPDGRAGTFVVHVTAPTGQTEQRRWLRPWRQQLARPGGYVIEYAADLGMAQASVVRVLVVDQPETLVTAGPSLP